MDKSTCLKDTYDINQIEPEGTFDWFNKYCKNFYLIEDAYKAVISTQGAPEYFKEKVNNTQTMFTLQNYSIWDQIHSKMTQYNYHSGYSYAWTMQNIEHIFKFGWNNWVYIVKKKYIDTN